MGWLLAIWLYAVGSFMMFWVTMYDMDDDPWYMRWLAILGWPILFPYAFTFGRNR